MRANIHYYHILLIGFLLGSCTSLCKRGHEDLAPEEVVQAYLDTAFNMTVVTQRELLKQFTTGALYESIDQASDATIKEAYIDKRYKLMRYSVLERRDRTPRETEISFELVYKNVASQGEGDIANANESNVPTVTTENVVSVIRKKGLWLIADVLNKTSSFDFPVADPCTEVTQVEKAECKKWTGGEAISPKDSSQDDQ